MPIYEYECTKCRHHFEIVQKITDAPKAKCPKCGHASKRLISQTSFALKGSGWYKDGYGASKKQEAVSGEQGVKSKETKKITNDQIPKNK